MSWYTEMLEHVAKRPSDTKTQMSLITSDLGKRKIELPEAYWRIVTLQAHAVAGILGLDWRNLVAMISAASKSPESMLLPSLIRATLTDAFDIRFGKGATQSHGMAMTMESVQKSVLHAWGYGKAVYDIDPDVAAAAVDTEMTAVPSEVLKYMPVPALYIPYKINDCVGIFFSKIDMHTGQSGLSFLMVKAGWPNIKADKGDFVGGTIDLRDNTKTIEDLIGTTNTDASDPDSFRKYMNLLVLLCCRNVEIVGRTTSTPGPSIDRNTRKPIMTPGPRHWDVGVRQGAALRANAAYASESAGEGTGRSVRAHLRRAHWCLYHKGPRNSAERSTILHWIAPILVGAATDLVETHHKLN